ncbi:Mitochondrial GTPase [Coelomomyces lativittatus]|nr:Mitochondrial GTPase [Coelomomyces lativittatus]
MTPNNVPLVTLPSHFKSLNWFPGHMYKAIKDIQDRLSKTQGFIEVRDARIPITSTHPKLNEWTKISNKKHIILLNKMDLADERKT